MTISTANNAIGVRSLDTLLQSRFGGAIAIRGIRFQILYSISRAFSLFDFNDTALIRLEGIEDVDLIGLTEGDHFIQVKTADSHWSWSQLKKPLQSFVESMRLNNRLRFTLVFNFPLERDFLRFSDFSALPSAESKRLREKFRKLCHSFGATAVEADLLLQKLSVESVSEKAIVDEIHKCVASQWEVSSEAIDLYLCVLVSTFLDWAQKRSVISRQDLVAIRSRTGEGIARESAFEAYGRGLLCRLENSRHDAEEEFFRGKGTRVEQIVAGLDIPRQKWIEEIDRIVRSGGVCVIKSSSGQGKSSLLFRYVVDHWLFGSTYQLQVAETAEQAQLVCEFLQGRAQMRLPTYLIIDNAGWRTKEWPRVVAAAESAGIPVIVTTRHEDWYRFGLNSVNNIGFVEPELTRIEASSLFAALKAKGRLHSTAESSDRAYDEIGPTKLLIEFIYLITQGTLLRERLEDQIRTIRRLGEDSAKIDVLSIVSLGHILSVEVDLKKLVNEIRFREDAQDVVNSIRSEFVEIGPNEICGLHQVRSQHLTDLLHDETRCHTDTALRLFRTIPDRAIAAFVFNALLHPQIDRSQLTEALAAVASESPLHLVLTILEGTFQAGEVAWLRSNGAAFRKIYESFGAGVHNIIAYKFLPIDLMSAWSGIEKLLRSGRDDFEQLDDILRTIEMGDRGLDWCGKLLSGTEIGVERLLSEPENTARLLVWHSQSGAQLRNWVFVRLGILEFLQSLQSTPEQLSQLLYGVGCYDRHLYDEWFESGGALFLSWLRYHTDSYRIELSNDEVFVEYFVDGTSAIDPHEQTMNRLRLLRMAIPNCRTFNCQGNWLLPDGSPSVDNTVKHIPLDSLPTKSDAALNGMWTNLFQRETLPKLSWSLQRMWSEVRSDALTFMQELNQILTARARGRTTRSTRFDDSTFSARLQNGFRDLPVYFDHGESDTTLALPQEMREFLRHRGPRTWSTSFENFMRFVIQYMSDSSEKSNRLCRVNFCDSKKYLVPMHAAFEILLRHSPDYFDVRSLNAEEESESNLLLSNLELWLGKPPKKPILNVEKYIEIRHRGIEAKILQRIRDAIAPLEEVGIVARSADRISVPHFHFDLFLQVREVAITFTVIDECFPEQSLVHVINALIAAADSVNTYWLIPCSGGHRLIDGAYYLSPRQLTELAKGIDLPWESFIPAKMPDSVSTEGLVDLPLNIPVKLQIRADIIKMFQLHRVFVERTICVAPLLTSEFEWDKRYFEEEYERNRTAIRELQILCMDIQQRLDEEFGDFRMSRDFEVVSQAIRTTSELCAAPEALSREFHQTLDMNAVDAAFASLCVSSRGET